ncbi:MAG TPA: pre-peptidase C-terminal domain-containing protein [Terricaulis sp.]|nr:pre-peptidase C-terminal domain-containing protein [Terricaulis sp.]
MRGKLMFSAASAAVLAMMMAGVAAAQTSDPTEDASTQAEISVGQSLESAIEPAGDADWYRLSVEQGQRYTVTLNATPEDNGLDPLLTVYDAQSQIIAQNDDADGTLNSRLSFVPGASGVVFVEAAAFGDGSAGGYTLSVAASPIPPDDAGNDATTRARVAPGRPITGVLEYEGDVDWYRLDARTGQRYRIILASAEEREDALSDPLLQVMDAEGNVLGYNDDYNGLNSQIDFVPTRSGPVYVVAGAFADAAAGAYTLSVESERLPRDPAAADTSTRARITLGQTVTSLLDYPGDRDWYRIRLTAGETYRFALNRNDEADEPLGDPLLQLYDARGEEVAMDDDGGGNLNALLEYTATATGNYFIEARGFSDDAAGGYTLSARAGDIPADASTDVSLSADGDYREGVLAPAGDRDWYRLTLSEGQTVRISLTSVDMMLDPLLVVYGPDGAAAATDDDGGEGLNSWLEFTATASGDHFVEARGFSDDAGGSYAVSIASGDIPDSSQTDEALGFDGQGRVSTLGAPGDVDWFAVDLVEARTYRFSVESTGETPLADPMLTIYDVNGEAVATDDDGGAGLNAYLTFSSVTGGPHFVAVSGYGDSTGQYYVRASDTDIPGHIYSDEALDSANGDERVSRIDIPGDLDVFRVDLEEGVRYVMEVNGFGDHALADPQLTLLNANDEVIASDDDSGPGRNARLRFTARESGAFFIRASGVGGATGTYQVKIVRQ